MSYSPVEPTGRIGIDLGGTKTEIIALDRDGAVQQRFRVPTPAHDYAAILHTLVQLIGQVEQHLGWHQAPVGLGIPGALSKATGLVKNANTTSLIGKPLADDLRKELGREVRIENDANCFALSEACDGAGVDGNVVFGVILGTGVGGGLVMQRRPWSGANHIAGEWGHNPLPIFETADLPAPPCYCGRHGCIETYLCGPALSRQYQAHTGEPCTAAELPARAEQGDVVAHLLLTRYYERLARCLAGVINVLDPDVIVLGGGVSQLPGLAEQVQRRLGRFVFSDRVDTVVRAAQHGSASGVRGAAWLWPDPNSPTPPT